MKITLTTKELEHAIACYLRANAAVDVGEMVFSLKKTGIQAEIETTVKEAGAPELKAQEVPQQLPLPNIPHTSEEIMLFSNQEEPTTFESNPEELVDEIPEETTNNDETEFLLSSEANKEHLEESIKQLENSDILNDLDEAIAEVKEELPDILTFETPEENVIEEMPVQDTPSIASILGLST